MKRHIDPFTVRKSTKRDVSFEAECGYCGRPATFKRESIIACDSNDQDQKYDGYCCQNCGEFAGQLARIIVCGNPSDSEHSTTRGQGE